MATILDNEIGHDAQTVQHNLSRFLNAMEHQKAQVGELAEGIDHFLKVTRRNLQGIFNCYQIKGLKRTNNDIENVFGKFRNHHLGVKGRTRLP